LFPGTHLVKAHQENMFPSAPIPGISFDPKVQALAYKVLHQYSGKSDLFEIVSRRIANWLGYIPIEFVPDQFEFASSLLRKMRCHEAMQIVKTWTNSWATSVRYHESVVFPCLLGCQDCGRFFGMIRLHGHPVAREGHPVPRDDFSHYLFCPSMWHIIDSIVLHSTPIDPLKRLGLLASNFENFFTLACAFHAYHSIKQVRDDPPSSLDFTKNIRLFSEAFISAARIVGLQYSRDSLDASA